MPVPVLVCVCVFMQLACTFHKTDIEDTCMHLVFFFLRKRLADSFTFLYFYPKKKTSNESMVSTAYQTIHHTTFTFYCTCCVFSLPYAKAHDLIEHWVEDRNEMAKLGRLLFCYYSFPFFFFFSFPHHHCTFVFAKSGSFHFVRACVIF